MSGVLTEAAKRGHEQVVFFNYPEVGLKAIVGIHNTVLGPSLGGCRMRWYDDENKAIEDALRLSEGMTYKSSLAGLDLGGGKAVLIADPSMKQGRKELFVQFGKCVDSLGGRYITAEDMGTTVADMMAVREATRYVTGFAQEEGGSGDPSPWTALGIHCAMKAVCKHNYGSESLQGKRIAIQGVGNVGRCLVERLAKDGAIITACDSNQEVLKELANKLKFDVVGIDQIYDVPCDIFSPNAIGQTVNHTSLARLKCEIICGAANNQLPDASVYETITSKGILYCPDFVVNSGGVINVAGEFVTGGYSTKWATEKVENIYNTTLRVLEQSVSRKLFPEVVAIELAKERIRQVAAKKAA